MTSVSYSQSAPVGLGISRRDGLFTFFAAVVLVQGVHVIEHLIQIVQVFVLGVPEEKALGLLGEFLQLQGTEEWLHLGFNLLFLGSLVILATGLVRRGTAAVPLAALIVFFVGAVGLETFHVVEHSVITANIVANNGCPCPGILDARLGVSDTVLHLFYNVVAYAATVIPFAYMWRNRAAAKTL